MNFLIVLFMVNWCYLASNQVAGITCNSQSQIMKNPRLGMKKRLGSVFEFRCKSKCNGSFSFFHHNHTTEKFDLIFQSPNDTYNIPLLSFDDGGEYCCSEQCNNKSTTPDMPDCCTRIKISPVVEWTLPKAVGLHGSPIHGSCSVTAYPRPAVRVITPKGCDSQKKNIHIGRHTNKVEFTIKNATKRCEKIHCFIQTFGELNTTELLIIENVSCGGEKRQTRSATANMLTALEREDIIISSRSLSIEGDHDYETHATGNSSATATCNKLMMSITLLMLLLFI